MSQENVEVVRGLLEAFASRDPERAFDFYEPEIEWHASKQGLIVDTVGVYRRHDGVREYLEVADRPPGIPLTPLRAEHQPTLRPYAVRHELDRPGIAALLSTAARHPHSRLEGVPRGEPASEGVLAGRRGVGHVSAERATDTSRGHPHVHRSRAVSGASKFSTPFEEPDPVQTRSQDFHLEPKLAGSVIPARVLAPIATVGGRESRGGGGVYAERHQPDDRERECRESAHVSRRP